jgi:undecaprenyl-diphosphatase
VKARGEGRREARLPEGTTSRGPLKTRVATPVRTASITVVGGFLGLLACLVVLGLLAESIRDKEVTALDTLATPFLHGLASPFLDGLMQAATFMGSNLAIPPLFALAVIWLILLHKPREALVLAIASGGSLVLNEMMKLFFQRPRPQLDWAQVLPDYSFPSGHTMNSVVFYVSLALVLWSVRGRRTGLAALAIGIALSLFIGVSRIYLGYHYLTDVVGGLLAGTAWLLIVAAAFRAGPLSRLWRNVDPGADADADDDALIDARAANTLEEPSVMRR